MRVKLALALQMNGERDCSLNEKMLKEQESSPEEEMEEQQYCKSTEKESELM